MSINHRYSGIFFLTQILVWAMLSSAGRAQEAHIKIDQATDTNIDIVQLQNGLIELDIVGADQNQIDIVIEGDEHYLSLSQIGEGHQFDLNATGDGVQINAQQFGYQHQSAIDLTNADNAMVQLQQFHTANRLDVTMAGSANQLIALQGLEIGSHNQLKLDQQNGHNSAQITQSGDQNVMDITQNSGFNQIEAHQSNGHNALTLVQSGHQTATIYQHGGRSLILHQSVPGVVVTQP